MEFLFRELFPCLERRDEADCNSQKKPRTGTLTPWEAAPALGFKPFLGQQRSKTRPDTKKPPDQVAFL